MFSRHIWSEHNENSLYLSFYPDGAIVNTFSLPLQLRPITTKYELIYKRVLVICTLKFIIVFFWWLFIMFGKCGITYR